MFQIDVLDYCYSGNNKPSLKDIKIDLPLNQLYFINGDNGSGKSTFGLLVAGIIPCILIGTLNGTIFFNNEILPSNFTLNNVAYLFQNPYDFFTGVKPIDELSLCTNKDTHYNELLKNIDLELPFNKLSTGQQQKVALASVMYSEKNIIVLDEPFEFLDSKSIETAKAILVNKISDGKTIIFIDHVLNQQTCFTSCKEIFFDKSTIVSTKHSVNLSDIIQKGSSSNLIFEIKNLSYKYQGQTSDLIKIKKIQLFEGELLGVVGSNGCGKSTLFYLLAGLLSQKKSIQYYKGNIIKSNKLRGIFKLAFQNPDFQLFQSDVRNEIEIALGFKGFDNNKLKEKIEFSRNFLSFDLDLDPTSLSFGQKKILTILITFLLEPEILILDEPFASLDNTNINKVIDLINITLAKKNSVIISTHNSNLLTKCCHRILEFKNCDLI